MTAKELLCQYQDKLKEIHRLHDHLRELRDLAENTTVDPTREKIQTSGSKDRLGDITARIADISCEILDNISECIDAMQTAEEAIMQLDNEDERIILQERYIEGLPWNEIEKRHYYSRAWLMDVHSRALKKISAKNESLD